MQFAAELLPLGELDLEGTRFPLIGKKFMESGDREMQFAAELLPLGEGV